MVRVSIELVPRNAAQFKDQLQIVKKHFPMVETINIPDIHRYGLTGLEGAFIAKKFFPAAIPHIRAMDFKKGEIQLLDDAVLQHKISEILVIRGDSFCDENSSQECYSTIELIKTLRKRHPSLKIYAGVDQYRSSLIAESQYIQEKKEAGIDGFFTQPFFDLRLMNIYADFLKGFQVFWGVSPVLSERSRNYWKEQNKVIFPPDFIPTIEWNKSFAQQVIAFCGKKQGNVYFMPIKADIVAYLTGII